MTGQKKTPAETEVKPKNQHDYNTRQFAKASWIVDVLSNPPKELNLTQSQVEARNAFLKSFGFPVYEQ